MAKSKWTVQVGDKTHSVEVRRKPWLAIAEVKVDGTAVTYFGAKAMAITIFNYRQHPFEIDGTWFTVVIKPNFIGYNFDLTLDGKVLPPDA